MSFKKPTSQPNLTAIAFIFHPPCLFVLLRKFAFPFSNVKFDWFFCCYRFLHRCYRFLHRCYRFLHFFLGLTSLKLNNHKCISNFLVYMCYYRRNITGNNRDIKKSCEMNEFNYFWCQCSFE